MPGVQMALHRGDGVAHQPERHPFVRRALVFNQHMHVAVTFTGFQGIKHIAVAGPQIILNETAGLQLQRRQVADIQQGRRQMQHHKIPGGFRLRKKGFEHRVVRRGRAGFLHPDVSP